MPVIIKEVFFPPDTMQDRIDPMTRSENKDRTKHLQEIATLIESSIVYQNTANYDMAIISLQEARKSWRQANSHMNTTLSEPRLRPELELYFEMSLGSVYESCGKDDMALDCYMLARTIKLPKNHPDEAFPYCGLGSVFYNIEEPAWALRCYLMAREIREERVGGDTVDTATVYNNIGACMFYLERNQEAKAFFELSNAIMEAELGPSHERTLTTARNILKSNKTVLDVKAEYRFLWSTYIPTLGKKGKKGKKKKGKK
jgi:tetratricopeptide (TPR) repeat protein